MTQESLPRNLPRLENEHRLARGMSRVAEAGSPIGIECAYCRALPGTPCAITRSTASVRQTGFHRARVLGETPPSGNRRGPRVRTIRHGLSGTPEYRAWQLIRLRCTDPKHRAYPRYGGRGIALWPAWVEDPVAFVAHVGPRPSSEHEIDRIDNDRGYEPGNLRWATRTENSRNRRNNLRITYQGETKTRIEWAQRFGIPADTLGERLARGWSVERALTEPLWNRGLHASLKRRAEGA